RLADRAVELVRVGRARALDRVEEDLRGRVRGGDDGDVRAPAAELLRDPEERRRLREPGLGHPPLGLARPVRELAERLAPGAVVRALLAERGLRPEVRGLHLLPERDRVRR